MKKKWLSSYPARVGWIKISRIMKLTTFLILFMLFDVSASVYSQGTKFSVKIENGSLSEIFEDIEEQSDFRFFYQNEQIQDIKRKTIDVSNKNIEAIMADLLDDTEVSYKIEEKNIIVFLKSEENYKADSATQQTKTISGKVTDSFDVLLPGVTIVIKGTTNGTITDIDGNYSLSQVPGNATLIFSFVGMKTQELEVGNQTNINVVLEFEAIGIEDIIVIGYGTTKRKNFTGSSTTIDVENSAAGLSLTTNVLSLLNGIASGVTFTQSGEVGTEPKIMVRGQKSISGGSDPLYVVDGMIFSGSLNDIDPNNIESMTVLKDATTLAAYGSKAANGVIMITTKKGKKGKPVINFNSSISLSSQGYTPKVRSAEGYIKLMNLRAGNDEDADPSAWMSALEKVNYDAGETINWRDYIDRTGVLQNYSLSFSGATDDANYYFSMGHLDQKGIYYGNDYSRNTFSANISTNINDYIKIGANTTFAHNTYEGVSAAYDQSIFLSPYAEPYLSDGKSMRKFVDGKESTTTNPLWDTYNGVDKDSIKQSIIIGGYLDIDIPHIKGLSFKVAGSYTLGSNKSREFTHETNFPEISTDDSGYTTEVYDKYLIDANGYIADRNTISWVLDNILTYVKEIGNHFINASFVYTRNSGKVESKEITGSNFTGVGNTLLGYYGLQNAEVQTIDDISYTLHNDVGYLGRLSYSYKDTYHLNASTRYDGSSVFGSDKKWGLFTAVGGAWTISNENFMKDIKGVNNLKFKFSWGKNGNQSLDPYGTLSTIAMGLGGGNIYYFDDIAYGQNITALGNSELGWETTTSLNYGIEADLINTLHVEIDAYNSKTKDQIFSRTIPVMGGGLTSQSATMGQVNNWGIEVNLTNKNIKTANFSWNTSLVFSINRNKLVELYGNGQDDIINNLFLGKSLGAIYGYKWTGVVQEGEENYMSNIVAQVGDAKYADINDDGKLTATDREILGYNKESFRLSMANSFTYNNFDLYILINGVFSGNGYGQAANNYAYLTDDTYGLHNTLDHPYWTSENPSETYPRYNYNDLDYFTALQSYGFIRLQNVNLSYTFDNIKLNRIGVNGLKIYASCSNLFCYSPKWEGSDPEIRAFDSAQLPRIFKFGLNLKF